MVRLNMLFRRLVVASIVLLVSVALGMAMIMTLAPGGWTAAKALMLLSIASARHPGSDFVQPTV